MSLVEHHVDHDADGGPKLVTPDIDAEVEAEIQRVVPEGFYVHSPQTAAWVVRRIVNARRYTEMVDKWAEAERRRAAAEEQRLTYLFGGQLRSWAEAEIAKQGGRRRSVNLPSGVVGFRAMPSRLIIHDETRLMKWARTNCPSAIVMSERLIKTPLAEHMKSTGEIPDGAAALEPRDEFYIR